MSFFICLFFSWTDIYKYVLKMGPHACDPIFDLQCYYLYIIYLKNVIIFNNHHHLQLLMRQVQVYLDLLRM